ncbi:hypothetical protein RvY_08860 [Ramazzottius varieornatus]|uniref:Uncharacterized protein n=1 Tax=Ramazzottius varieornatus TaxID=947166 RepID=A0A1D1VCX1_RAMVA|nr:hypothetical protein RvY_08860 [Ramazzottius varieornatus]
MLIDTAGDYGESGRKEIQPSLCGTGDIDYFSALEHAPRPVSLQCEKCVRMDGNRGLTAWNAVLFTSCDTILRICSSFGCKSQPLRCLDCTAFLLSEHLNDIAVRAFVTLIINCRNEVREVAEDTRIARGEEPASL